MERRIAFFGDYFDEFYKNQNTKVRTKIDYVLGVVKYIEKSSY
jgi:hypothetical protein